MLNENKNESLLNSDYKYESKIPWGIKILKSLGWNGFIF